MGSPLGPVPPDDPGVSVTAAVSSSDGFVAELFVVESGSITADVTISAKLVCVPVDRTSAVTVSV